MATAYTYLRLTDGTVTADLVDGTNYQLRDNSWAPAVSARRVSRMAGQSPYEDVVEEIVLFVRGATTAVALTNLAKLTYLLDQADRYWEGDDVAPVTLVCQPQGSDLAAPVSAMVLGRPPGSAGWMGLPSTFNDYLMLFEAGPVTLRFLRSGLWLGASESPSASTKTANPVIKELTFAGGVHSIPSPIDVAVTGFDQATHLIINPGILLVANTAAQLQLVDAEDGTAANWTAPTDAGQEPVGGNVLRYTAPSTAESTSGALTVASFGVGDNVYITSVYASVRVNTASRTFYLRAEGTSFVFNDADRTPDVPLSRTDYTFPLWVHLGFLKLRGGLAELRLVASVDSSLGSPTLDIDTIALQAVAPGSYAIAHETGYLSSPFVAAGNDVDLIVEQRSLSERSPFVGIENITVAAENSIGYAGDPAIYMAGSKAATLWLSTNASDWVDTNQSTGAVISIGMKAARRKAYLVPQ